MRPPATPTHAPSTEAEVCALVREAAAAKTPLEILGGGSRRSLGAPVRAAAALSTAGLSAIPRYEPEALTLVAEAGAPLSVIEAALAAEGQMLPFEPIDHRPLLGSAGTEPTIGGVVACGVSGPRRFVAGACRDALLGVRFVNGAGEAVKSGGRVMKNVTGYDLVKLMAGAYGTLGVLTEAAFKLLPKPEMTATLVLQGLGDDAALAAMTAALTSPYGVTGAAHQPEGPGGAPVTALRLEGFADSVAYRAKALREALAPHLSTGADAAIDDDQIRAAAGWAEIRDVAPFADRPGAVWRLAVRPSAAAGLVAAIQAERAAAALYDWGGGLIWLLTPEDGEAGAALIRAETAKAGGDATLVRATEALRSAIPVFPPQPAPIAKLTAGLKAAFDPAGVLNPGRMAGC